MMNEDLLSIIRQRNLVLTCDASLLIIFEYRNVLLFRLVLITDKNVFFGVVPIVRRMLACEFSLTSSFFVFGGPTVSTRVKTLEA